MQNLKSLMAALLIAVAGTASATVITEEYKGKQSVDRGDSYTFDFDMWYENSGTVNDNAPGLTLTTDAEGAYGNWSSATLYIDFTSNDSQAERANIDLDAWGFRLFGFPIGDSDVLEFSGYNVSPAGGSSYYFSYNLAPSQIALLDEYGWGSLRIGASNQSGNDFDITRVGLSVTTAAAAIPEPATLALLAGGLLGLGAVGRRRPRK